MPRKSEIAAFEAGIKLGALYHQFIGMPINIDMVDDVKKIIEASIRNQPYVDDVKVSIDKDEVRRDTNIFGYTTLKSSSVKAYVRIVYGEYYAEAVMEYDTRLNYPLMRLLKTGKIRSR